MIIGSSHGVGGGPTQTEALSTVVAQLEPIHATCMEEVNKNIDQIIQYMEIGARGFPGYDLFVSPEFGVQGMHPLERLKVVLTLDSPEVGRLKEACARLKVWGIFGVILKLEGHEAPGNCAIMINDEGEVVHQYCKMNPWIPTERHYPGWECPVTPGPKGSRIATIVCADGDYPEIWREAAYNGANVVVRITHYMNPWEEPWKLTNRCAAYCNQVYVVGANCYGMEHACAAFGNSMIINPDGNIVTEAPMMVPYLLKADLYPGLVDKLHESSTTNTFLYSFRHRGAACKELGGHGVTAKVDGKTVAAGNARLMAKLGLTVPEITEPGTIVHVAMEGRYAGYLLIADVVKPHSAAAIKGLKQAGVRKTVMLTGDAEPVAKAVSAELGLDEYHAGLLPGDKVDQIETLLAAKQPKENLAFVGDGINDAPVLSRADVGIAMGALGSDAAIEAADVVLMDDDPAKIALAMRIARRTLRIVYQNIVFALAIKFACLVLGALGLASMWTAIFADVGVMVLAVLNATRALYTKDLAKKNAQ